MHGKDHQAALDGIRGFAAISVVIYHIGHWLDAPMASNSFLAVDLFFLLSGYVLSLAYANRLDSGMGISHFIVLRLVRLMPLVIIGTLISSVYTILRIHVKHEEMALPALAAATLLGIFNVPYLVAPSTIGGDQVFPLNGPQFSLFLEVFVNIVWAALAFFRRKWTAGILTVACFALIVRIGILGGDTSATFVAGFPRVCASFLAGVVIFHLNIVVASWRWWPTVFWICCVVMLVTFYAPTLPIAYQIAWTSTVSPLLVLSGACTNLHGWIRSLALVSGRFSYPIYILHYPVFVWINGTYQIVTHRRDVELEGVIVVASVIIMSAILLRFYDEPIRYKLNNLVKGTAIAGDRRPVN